MRTAANIAPAAPAATAARYLPGCCAPWVVASSAPAIHRPLHPKHLAQSHTAPVIPSRHHSLLLPCAIAAVVVLSRGIVAAKAVVRRAHASSEAALAETVHRVGVVLDTWLTE